MQSHGLLHDHPPPSRAILDAWLDEHAIERHEALEVVDMVDGSGWTVKATRPIQMDEYRPYPNVSSRIMLKLHASLQDPQNQPLIPPHNLFTPFHPNFQLVQNQSGPLPLLSPSTRVPTRLCITLLWVSTKSA